MHPTYIISKIGQHHLLLRFYFRLQFAEKVWLSPKCIQHFQNCCGRKIETTLHSNLNHIRSKNRFINKSTRSLKSIIAVKFAYKIVNLYTFELFICIPHTEKLVILRVIYYWALRCIALILKDYNCIHLNV